MSQLSSGKVATVVPSYEFGRAQRQVLTQNSLVNAILYFLNSRYLQENIDFTYDENENENLINPLPLVNLLDKTAQNTVIRTSQTDLHEADRRGLLWLLDEESIYPGGKLSLSIMF